MIKSYNMLFAIATKVSLLVLLLFVPGISFSQIVSYDFNGGAMGWTLTGSSATGGRIFIDGGANRHATSPTINLASAPFGAYVTVDWNCVDNSTGFENDDNVFVEYLNGSTWVIIWTRNGDQICPSSDNNQNGNTGNLLIPAGISSTQIRLRSNTDSNTEDMYWDNVVVTAVPDPCAITASNPDSDGDGISDLCDLDNDNDGILDIDEDCIGYRAQNVNGTWLGNTSSTLTVTTAMALQSGASSYQDGQNNYWIAQNGGGQRLSRQSSSSHSITYTFSTGVPASDIAFLIVDVDPSISAGSPSAEFTFLVNGSASSAFAPVTTAPGGTSMNYNNTTGRINLNGASNDQYILLKGSGNTLVTSITLASTGTGSGDAIAYSLFASRKCDTDLDGIPDHLDLDSDNDGCPDAIEGSENVIRSQLNADTSISGAVDANGVPVLVNTGGTADAGNNTLGQGKGTSANSSLKDPACVNLVLNADSYSGNAGTAFTTPNILLNDLLDLSVPVIGGAAGQVVVSQSGVWPAGITLNTATGQVNVANTVNGGVYVVNYQTCVNGPSPSPCETQTITITVCGKFPATGTPNSFTKTGVSSFVGFANGWPTNVPNGFIAIESNNKGFVITRVKKVSDIPSADLVEGMLVYDIEAACVKLYNGTVWKCLAKDCN